MAADHRDDDDDARKRLAALRREVERETGGRKQAPPAALVKPSEARALVPDAPAGPPHKSVVASGLVSLVAGPLGWLYAAPLPLAAIASLAYLALWAILPHVLMLPLLALLHPAAAAGGVLYALRHNQKGQRATLLPPEEKQQALPEKKRG